MKTAVFPDVSAISHRAAAWLELERDRTFQFMTPATRLACVDRSLAIGAEQAGRYAGSDAFILAAQWSLRVCRRDEMEKTAGSVVRSRYDGDAMAVEISNASVAQVEKLLASLRLAGWPRRRVEALHLAHELFHHLEAGPGAPCDAVPKIATWKLGPMCLLAERPLRCSEIAAHSFAMHLCGLPFMPNLLDILLQVDSGARPLAWFERRVALAQSACE